MKTTIPMGGGTSTGFGHFNEKMKRRKRERQAQILTKESIKVLSEVVLNAESVGETYSYRQARANPGAYRLLDQGENVVLITTNSGQYYLDPSPKLARFDLQMEDKGDFQFEKTAVEIGRRLRLAIVSTVIRQAE